MERLSCDRCDKSVSPLKQERVKVSKRTQQGRLKETVKKLWLCRGCRHLMSEARELV